ncbi:hypothetical protein QM012_002587 [Aureobasidium pullulans]|uniref:Transcription factor domain-containing protein n=1 Tax=Aureobasidium pullulans TaxID=5580 RepID=A0ABR0TB69_AURPU
MTTSWKEDQQDNPHFQNQEEQSTIAILHNLLNQTATPELAAAQITSTYEPCLLQGRTDLCLLWRLICLAVIHPMTTHQNLEELAEMLVYISRSPDVMANGKVVGENGREYWHDLPEFSFWFMEYTMSVNPIESIDEGWARISWSQQARRFEVANCFGAILLGRIDPNLALKVSRGLNRLALETIRDALEVSIKTPAQIRRTGIYIPAAAQWFIHSSSRIWAFCKNKEGYEGERVWKQWLGGSDGSNPIWLGDDGFSVERWRFWKERFVAVLEIEGGDGCVFDHARRAAKAMDDAEQEGTLR